MFRNCFQLENKTWFISYYEGKDIKSIKFKILTWNNILASMMIPIQNWAISKTALLILDLPSKNREKTRRIRRNIPVADTWKINEILYSSSRIHVQPQNCQKNDWVNRTDNMLLKQFILKCTAQGKQEHILQNALYAELFLFFSDFIILVKHNYSGLQMSIFFHFIS